jgi:hypothetical protein
MSHATGPRPPLAAAPGGGSPASRTALRRATAGSALHRPNRRGGLAAARAALVILDFSRRRRWIGVRGWDPRSARGAGAG